MFGVRWRQAASLELGGAVFRSESKNSSRARIPNAVDITNDDEDGRFYCAPQ